MPKTKRERRRRRDRAPADASAGPAPAVAPAPPPPRDVSWMGIIGGVLGALLVGQAGVYAVVSPGYNSRLISLPLFAVAAIYLPAVWASATPTPQRQKVQRAVLAVTLIIVVIGVLLVDVAFATLLMAPSTLLAIAGGLIFQGSGAPTGKRKAGR